MLVEPLFYDRAEAGRFLAQKLKPLIANQSTVILALPRGGVPIGFEIAQNLHCDLDIFLVRKIGVPGQEELAMGAVASGGVRVLNQSIIRQLRISDEMIEVATQREEQEIARREALYREGRPRVDVAGRTVVLVDDGLATGATMLAAARGILPHPPARVVIGFPLASVEACEDFRGQVDEVVCGATPQPFGAVGIWYQDFSQVSDDEVREFLERAAHHYAQ